MKGNHLRTQYLNDLNVMLRRGIEIELHIIIISTMLKHRFITNTLPILSLKN
jgi:hypothetical protein